MTVQAVNKENVPVKPANEAASTTEDKMEIVVQKTIHLMQVLRDSDADPEKVRFAAKSLETERELIKGWDKDREDPLRDLLYDFSQSIEYAMLWYVDREEKLMKVKKEEPLDDSSELVVAKAKAAKGGKVVKEEPKEATDPKDPKDPKEAKGRKRVVVKEEVEDEDEPVDVKPPVAKKPAETKKPAKVVKTEPQSPSKKAKQTSMASFLTKKPAVNLDKYMRKQE